MLAIAAITFLTFIPLQPARSKAKVTQNDVKVDGETGETSKDYAQVNKSG